jgi:alpha-mannosidase
VEREPFDSPLVLSDERLAQDRSFRRAEAFRYPAGELRHAWKTLLQNHPHDSICGCSIDAVHEENMTRFARAGQVADAVVESALDAIADSVEPAAPGAIRAVVVNPDASERAQVVEAFIDLPVDSAEPWRLVDAQALDRPVVFWPREAAITSVVGPDGQGVAFQVLGEEQVVSHVMSRYETPWALNVRRVRLLWWAPSLPTCGYAAFDVEVGTPDVVRTFRSAQTRAGLKACTTSDLATSDLATHSVISTERSAQNEWLRLSVNDDGTFDVTEKATGVTYERAAALEDVGDVGDEYNYCPPASDRRVTNADASVTGISRVCAGALRATFRVDLELPLPLAAGPGRTDRAAETVAMPVSIQATLDAGSPRVVFAVAVDNRACDHRLRIRFPTGATRVETARADTAFDLVIRPARHAVPEHITNEAPVSSAPMISLVDAGDARTGATVIGKGLMEYEIVGAGDEVEEPAIALTLLRAVGDLSRNDLTTRPSGHAGPPVATPGAQCLGRHRFEMAFEPRPSVDLGAVGPSPGALFASARAHTIQPRVVVARRPDNNGDDQGRPRRVGGERRSFLRVDRRSGDLVLSALKQADDRASVIVRLFNPGAEAAEASLALDANVVRAFAVNFLEERQAELAVNHNVVIARLRPHQIQTIEIVVESR